MVRATGCAATVPASLSYELASIRVGNSRDRIWGIPMILDTEGRYPRAVPTSERP
jgi:hypothetical protein